MKRLVDIFREAAIMINDTQKVLFLKNNYRPSMEFIIKSAYHPAIVWDLPEGAPTYTPNKNMPEHIGALDFEARKLDRFFALPGKPSKGKKIKLFMDLLEKVNADEATFLLSLKERNIPGVSYDVCREAFPDWLPPNPKKGK